YRIHTEVGHRCRGCKINGRMVPLNTLLHTADQVEVLTGKNESPSRDWLSLASGYLNTARARAKVQNWFRKQDFEKNVTAGKAIIEKEFRRLGLRGINLDVIAEKLHKQDVADLYASLGVGDISLEQVVRLSRLQLSIAVEEK